MQPAYDAKGWRTFPGRAACRSPYRIAIISTLIAFLVVVAPRLAA